MEIRLRKIHLFSLLELLNKLYNNGVDYVDICGNVQEEEDTVIIGFNQDYVNAEYVDTFNEIVALVQGQELKTETKKLTDEDLNGLI